MPSFFEDVEEFNRRFGLPHSGDGHPPGHLEPDVLLYRIGFMLEELTEFAQAAARGDLAGMTDALVDLTYIALGTAAFKHLPFEEAWAEVHRANMAKEPVTGADDPRSPRGHRLDVVKPDGWTPPDIEAILERRRRQVLKDFQRGVVRDLMLSERSIG